MGNGKSANALQIFDMSVFFGRLFSTKQCTSIISKILENNLSSSIDSSELKVSIFLACRTIISILEEPIKYASSLTPQEILLFSQGLLLDYKIRLPEESDMFISTLPFALMNRNSQMYHNLNSYLTEINNDRYNKELVASYTREINFHISHSLLFHTMKKYMANFEKCSAGRCYDFSSCRIADIDAEYIMLSRNSCYQWFKKIVLSFIFRTVLREASINSLESVSPYSKNTINEYLNCQLLYDQYNDSLILNSLHSNIMTEKSKLDLNYRASISDMVKSVKNAKAICAKINLPSNYSKNDHLLNRKGNIILDKKQIAKSEQVRFSTDKYISNFSGFFINKLEFSDYVYNATLTKALKYVQDCISSVNSDSTKFYKYAVVACNTLARIDRMEYFMRDLYKEFRPEIYKIFSNFSHFIEGVQKYQNNMWFDSACSFYKY